MGTKNEAEVRELIKQAFHRALPAYDGSTDGLDLFDQGATSLTIVDLQLQVESAIGWSVDAYLLMEEATLDGWTSIYMRNRREI